ncbi:Rid family hydrolase [Streptomyces alkaliphilus]|uniref:Rid family hydrolase n=1 Tax=Streptomyces alkaliphilus TaxID=1472722 RepID=UPI001E46F5D7|nr:Rid family hydrolase [Streptomyces alkaliphilus]
MTTTVITTGNAPSLPAPLSQGIRKGPVPQVSEQLPFDPDTGEVVGTTVAEQTTQTLRDVARARYTRWSRPPDRVCLSLIHS